MKAVFKLSVNSIDYTDLLNQYFVELRFVDQAGTASDYIQFKLDDSKSLQEPTRGAELSLEIGYDKGIFSASGLQRKGRYIHDETEFIGPPPQMVIRASAIDFRKALKSGKNRSFDYVTISSIVQTIASEHGYLSVVDPSVALTIIDHKDQVDTPDLVFLRKLADQYGCIFKAAGNKLMFVPSGGDKSAAIKALLGSVTITPDMVTSWRVLKQDRSKYDAVQAKWWDLAGSQQRTITVGEGNSVYTIPEWFPTEAEATAAAKAKLKRLLKIESEIELELPGNEKLVAEGQIRLEKFRPGIDGKYTLTRVEHILSKTNGYQNVVKGQLDV